MTETPLKDMAQHLNLKAGHFIFEFDTPGLGHIMKSAGCDFVIFDTEHSGFGIDTTKRVMRYMQAAEVPTVVRVPSKDYKDIARTLDAGAEGLMLPMVSTPEEAEQIVQSMKYVPRGGPDGGDAAAGGCAAHPLSQRSPPRRTIVGVCSGGGAWDCAYRATPFGVWRRVVRDAASDCRSRRCGSYAFTRPRCAAGRCR